MGHPNHHHHAKAIVWAKVRLVVFGLDEAFSFLVRQTFRKLNVREIQTYSAPADIAGMVERGADLLLIDLSEQPQEGLAVLEGMRRFIGDAADAIPILVVVSAAQTDMADRARAYGIEGVVPKAVSGHELVHRVTETLRRPERMKPPTVPVRPLQIEAAAPPGQPAAKALPAAEAVTVAPPPSSPTPVAPTPAPLPPPPPAPPAPVASAPAAPVVARGGMASLMSRFLPRPSAGGAGGGSAAVPVRLSGGSLGEDDLPPARKSAGTLGDDDLAPPPTAKPVVVGVEVAAPRPDPDAEAARRRAERRRQVWQDELAHKGHKKRKGRDTTVVDVSSVVADHVKWLQTKGAEGKRASFSGMDLAGADISSAILANATFREVDLSDACLAESRLDGSDFRYATLSAADLSNSNLGVASLRHAKLGLANLEGASLRGSDLSGAKLSGARMAGADFKGAVLVGTDLREADLSQADNMTQGQVDKALCDMSTRLPPGVSRPRPKKEV
jgi:DNA-binding NarL/FixJ family response regulator